MKIIDLPEKQQLAIAMYRYFEERHPTRLGLKNAFEEQGLGSVRTFERRVENPETMSEGLADWIIKNLTGEIDTVPLRNLFLRTLGDQPEEFGYILPTMEPLPFDQPTPKLSTYERWKKGELRKQPETV